VPITSGTYLQPEHRWECPNCDLVDVTHEAQPHTRMHVCPGLKHLTAPMIPAGTRCKVEAKEREDYVGKEDVAYNEDGTPMMSVETTREDGNDVAVLAPCASVKMRME
jgi:hypothetical protein